MTNSLAIRAGTWRGLPYTREVNLWVWEEMWKGSWQEKQIGELSCVLCLGTSELVKKKSPRIAFALKGILHSEDRETWLFRDAGTEWGCSFLTMLVWCYPISFRLGHFPLWLWWPPRFSLLPSCPHLATLSNKHSKTIPKALLIEGTHLTEIRFAHTLSVHPSLEAACRNRRINCMHPTGRGNQKQKGQIIEEVWLINAVGTETLQEQTNTLLEYDTISSFIRETVYVSESDNSTWVGEMLK